MPVEKFIRDAIILWATIDPISTLLVFVALTSHLPKEERQRIALRATLYAAAVLVGAIVLGQILLSSMGISMLAFQLAGGIVLFMLAVRFIFGGVTEAAGSLLDVQGDVAVFPLALPVIATPGAILSVIVLTDNHLHPLPIQLGTTLITLLVLGVGYLILRASAQVLRVIGQQGAAMIVRVMGLILAALSIELILDALHLAGFLP
jgi:multiple antibiotic resistance protein